MYHSFLIHSPADGHLGFFHVLAIINSAETGPQLCFPAPFFLANFPLCKSQSKTRQKTRPVFSLCNSTTSPAGQDLLTLSRTSPRFLWDVSALWRLQGGWPPSGLGRCPHEVYIVPTSRLQGWSKKIKKLQYLRALMVFCHLE